MAPNMSRFDQTVSKCSCSTILHPWNTESCLSGALWMMRSAAFNTIPFALLFYTAKLGLRLYKTGGARQDVLRLPERVFRTTLFAVFFSGGFLTTACFLRKILGKFRIYTLALVPGFVGGFAIFTQQNRDLRYFVDTFYVTAVEYFVRLAANKYQLTKDRHGTETLIFSAISSCLAYLQSKDQTVSHIPWFHWPEKSENNFPSPAFEKSDKSKWPLKKVWASRTEQCKHRGGCIAHLSQGMVKFVVLGSTISLLQDFIPRIRSLVTGRPHSKVQLLSWGLPAFLASYVAIFRGFRCLLCRIFNDDSDFHCALCGLIAGLCYSIKPSYSIFGAALASTLELVWRRVEQWDGLPSVNLRSCPRMVCAVSLGVIMHAYVHEPTGVCPPVTGLFLSPCSGGCAEQLVATYRKILAGN